MVMRISLQGQKGLTRIILSMALIFLCFMGRIGMISKLQSTSILKSISSGFIID